MRYLFATGLISLSLALSGVSASAQEPISETTMRPHKSSPMVDTRSQQLVQERAALKARYRTARLESRMWMGQQPLRPVMGSGTNASSTFQRWDYGGGSIPSGFWGYYGPIYGPNYTP